MSWADTTAVVTAVKTVTALATATYVSVAPSTTTKPYAIVHPKDGIPEPSRVTGPALTEYPEFTLHIVGTSTNSVQVVADLLKAVFVVNGFPVPRTVAGRINRDAYWRMPLPIQVDNDPTPALVWAVIEYGWTSDSA